MIEINEKQVWSTDKYIHRIGTDHYGKAMTLYPNEGLVNFEEVYEIPEEPIEYHV